MLPSGWTRIDQDRFKLAVEALRKARATRSCDGRYASALLDGFSVDEITAAEEVLG